MAASTKFLCVIFLCTLIVGDILLCAAGDSRPCTEDNLKITQSATGKKVENKPEWSVTLTNDCACSRLDIRLSCDGFQTVEEIDPSILKNSGNECVVNNGQPIPGRGTFNFTYAWDTSFNFQPLFYQITCP